MEDEKKASAGALSTSGLWVVVLLAAGAYFIHEVPLQGSRPTATDPKPYPYVARQDVDARLWQDPLSAITRGREDARKRDAARLGGDAAAAAAAAQRLEAQERGDHAVEGLARDIRSKAATAGVSARILAVMVQGGSYAESVEARRRARYAVLAGLKQNRLAPDDAAHLGYVLPRRAAVPDLALPEFVGYEWYKDDAGKQWVLVLWLDEYVFGSNTVARVSTLQDALGASRWSFAGFGAVLDAPADAARRKAVEAARTRLRSALVDDVQVDAALDFDGATRPSFDVLGPVYSSTLEDMARRAQATVPSRIPADAPTFYAYTPTADAANVLHDPSAGAAAVQAVLASHGVRLIRTIGDDGELAVALKDELARRGVDVPRSEPPCKRDATNHIVLIAEWDTLYGRTLPALVARTFGDVKCDDKEVPYLHNVSYLRGLDGQLPQLESAELDAARHGNAARTNGTAPVDRNELQKQIERPEGQGQLDYLRRMAAELREQDRARQSNGEGSIAAIGVLGSDVFDKLLILQALRADFQNVIFFTTDLDARMLHPQEQAWARNLVVASHFGLQLHRDLQQDIPPFRDSYQTSTYLTTLIALRNAPGRGATRIDQCAVDRLTAAPRLFEIGRTGPFDFGAGTTPKRCAGLVPTAIASEPRANDASCATDLSLCAQVHPESSPTSDGSLTARFYKRMLLAVVALLLLAIVTRAPRRAVAFLRGRSLADAAQDPWRPEVRFGEWRTMLVERAAIKDLAVVRRWYEARTGRVLVDPGTGALALEDDFTRWLATRTVLSGAAFVVGCGLAIGLLLAAQGLWRHFSLWLTQDGRGEPITFVEGISVWPTELIRLTVFLLAILFTFAASRRLNINLVEISRRLRFEPTFDRMVDQVHDHYAGWPFWTRVLRVFSYRLHERSGGPRRPIPELTWSAQLFWMKYLYQGRGRARTLRSLLALAMYFAVGFFVITSLGMPNTPYRGEVSLWINKLMLALSVGSMLFVLFFVVDALVFGCQIIRELAHDVLGDPADREDHVHSRWARSTRTHYGALYGIGGRNLDAMILMDFISLRTEVIAGLVYFPFIVIALMVLSRNRYFDNWTMPLGLIIVFASSVAIIIVCAIRLRRTAEAARARVLELLEQDLIRRQAQPGVSTIQVETLIERVRGLKTGAFAPYTQQPIVRAVLLPLTTLGGPTLLEYLSLANF